MTNEVIFYREGLRYEWLISDGETVSLSGEESSDITVTGLKDKMILKQIDGKVNYQIGEKEGLLKTGQHLLGGQFYIREESPLKRYMPFNHQDILIDSQSGSDFRLPEGLLKAVMEKKDGKWHIMILSGQVFLNNRLQKEKSFFLSDGDELSLEDSQFKIFSDEIGVKGSVEVGDDWVSKWSGHNDYYKDYPDYHRSPRIIYRSSEDKVDIKAPDPEPRKPENGLLRMIIPPLVMVSVTILISVIQPRGIYILVTMAMSVVTVVFSVITYFKNRKQYKSDIKNRIDQYHRYLIDKSIELNRLASEQKRGQLYHYPDIKTIDDLAARYDHRIYEKTILQFDFLHYRLGLGEVRTTYPLRYSQPERSGKTDPLEKEGYALYRNQQTIKDLPVVANLMHGPVGYIGPRKLVLEQLQLMVSQLAFFHSYHDVQFITIMPEEEKTEWEWMRWLPHATLQEVNVRGFVYNQRTRDQVLNSLNQILKQRQNQRSERSNTEERYSPHYVVLITDETLILDHVIMEFFNEDPTALGCSLVFVEDVLSGLSENIQTIVNIKDRNTGQLVIEEGQLKEQNYQLDHFPQGYDKERIARQLAPLRHLQNLKSSIPDSVTFMELYHAERFEDLAVLKRWEAHAPYESLSVPLGLRGQDDVVSLNLHEKAHGPHGLVAGTTGSGKSEIIQSYILSLAVNFHPYDVAFLLIDYKGGGMANLFKNLPHLLGTITNLDGAASMRALISINAELKRRQRLFSENDVNHINQYQKKYKLGEVTEPMPHLFLISDEFAELKSNQPEFMDELVSTARIGRSLGIHLILATQKPTGVVNDQIWSNSRFKLALKVADKQDSQEMLHTPDAADITQAGRAYLQVGNNEVYELFQSAWSGADYQAEKEDQGIEDQTIYAINDLGQYDLLNEDLSGLREVDTIKEMPSELDAIVSGIHDLVAEEAIKPLPQPWLPPLGERIAVTDLHDLDPQTAWQSEESDLIVTIGQADIPQEQKQETARINLSQDGDILLYGAPTTGKTTFLQTVIIDLARRYSPERVTFYALDFGTNGLSSFLTLPHMADILTLDQENKISKFVRVISKEITRRKNLLSQSGVGTIDLYRQKSDTPLSDIIIVLDNLEAIKDEPFNDILFKLLIKISREGLAVGLHLILTASRQANLRATLFSNFKHQLTLKQNDEADVKNVVGKTDLSDIEDIKGRALMKRGERVDSIQFALPVVAANEIDLLEKIRTESLAMRDLWQGEVPSGIPMVPDELTESDFYERVSVLEAIKAKKIPLGLDLETVQAKTWAFNKGSLLYLTDSERAMVQFATYLDHLNRKEERYLITLAPSYHQLPSQLVSEIVSDPSEVSEMIEALHLKIDERLKNQKQDQVAMIMLYDWNNLIVHLSAEDQGKLATIITKGSRAGYMSVIISDPSVSSRIDPASKAVRAVKEGLLGVRLSDQTIFNVLNRPIREDLLGNQIHYYIHDNKASQVKVLMRKE